jgi:hypothetical protein
VIKRDAMTGGLPARLMKLGIVLESEYYGGMGVFIALSSTL